MLFVYDDGSSITCLNNDMLFLPGSISDVSPGVYMANYNVGYSNEIAITSLTKQEYALTSVPASLTLTNIISSIHEMFVDDESLLSDRRSDCLCKKKL